MTEDEILKIVTTYFTDHWKEVLLSLMAFFVTVVSGTWFVARMWYTREINHLKSQINFQGELHAERIGVLNEKVDERTIYAKGLVELSEQRVLAIEEEKKDLTKQIALHENELVEVRHSLARMKSFEREASDKELVAENRSQLVKEIIVVLNFTVHRSNNSKNLSKSFTKLIDIIEKELVSVRVLSAFLVVLAEVTETAMRAVLEAHITTEKLSRFHESYYKSIKNIVSPVADALSLKDLDLESDKKHIEKDIEFLEDRIESDESDDKKV